MTSTATPEHGAPGRGRGRDGGRRGRNRGRRAVLGVVVLALLLYVAVSGVLAWQIRSEVFAVRSWPPSTAEVVAVDRDRIVLDDAAEPWPALRLDARYGLAWDGGYGEVSGPAAESGDGVSRDFELIRGTAPVPGDEVTLERDLVDVDAVTPLVETQEVTYPSGRGELPALFVPGPSSTWAILVHGKGASAEEMLRMAQATSGAGLPTLAISYRNDAGTPPDPSGRHAFGQTEWRDLEAAVTYARGEGADGVVLGGASMGGGIVAAYLESSDREPGLVRGVVLDAPMLDLASVVDNGAAQLELPLGLSVPTALVASGRRLVSLVDGVDWDAVSYVDDTSWLHVPTLVLHTTEDTTVPISSSRRLAEEEPTLVALEEFPGGHVEAYNADPDRYLALVTDFLAQLPE